MSGGPLCCPDWLRVWWLQHLEVALEVDFGIAVAVPALLGAVGRLWLLRLEEVAALLHRHVPEADPGVLLPGEQRLRARGCSLLSGG